MFEMPAKQQKQLSALLLYIRPSKLQDVTLSDLLPLSLPLLAKETLIDLEVDLLGNRTFFAGFVSTDHARLNRRFMRTATFQPSTRPQDFWDLTSFFQSFSTLGSTFLQTHCKSSLQVCNIHNLKSCSEFLANPTTSASKPLYYRLFRQIQRRTSTESSSCEIRQRSSGIR